MSAQFDLELDPKTRAPVVTPAEIDHMVSLLRGKDWQTAAQLGAMTELTKRSLRAIAEASKGHIISGQKGYKLTLEATTPEIDSMVWLKHQGEKMIQRFVDIQSVRHRHFAHTI
jgi:hypothetical protein